MQHWLHQFYNTCTILVKDYTAVMGACDLNNQMTKLYCSRKHYRWPRRLMMWCSYNAYIIEGKIRKHAPEGHRPRTIYDFLDELCLTLIGNFRTTSVCRNRASQEVPESSLQNIGLHHPEQPAEATTNQTCLVCHERVKKYLVAHPGTATKNIPYKKKTFSMYMLQGLSLYI